MAKGRRWPIVVPPTGDVEEDHGVWGGERQGSSDSGSSRKSRREVVSLFFHYLRPGPARELTKPENKITDKSKCADRNHFTMTEWFVPDNSKSTDRNHSPLFQVRGAL